MVELWSTEHLTDLIMSDAFRKEVPAIRPAVIILYETQCKNKIQKLLSNQQQQQQQKQLSSSSSSSLPNSMNLIMAVFDRTAAKNVWYQWDEDIMDVFKYYNIETKDRPRKDWCPTVLFQPQNWTDSIQFYNPTLDGNFISWIWKQLEIQVEFTNELDVGVNLFINSKDESDIDMEQLVASIEPQQTVTASSLHSSDIVLVRRQDNQNVVNRYILNMVDKKIAIKQSKEEKIINTEKFNKDQETKLTLQQQRDWSTRRRYLDNIRIPPLLPHFTDTGFKVSQLPDDVCEYLLDFYQQNKNNARTEAFPKDGTQINVREISTWMMHIPEQKRYWIGERLQPILEEWSGTKLQYSTIYGLREYKKGAVLKTHVDRIETHIISAILHVAHEPDLKEAPWPLELVSWDGKRYYVQDDVCSMVFYESSKLIHGRPTVYNGTSWINAFLHYRPDYWDSKGYRFTPDNIIITPEGQTNLVDWIYG